MKTNCVDDLDIISSHIFFGRTITVNFTACFCTHLSKEFVKIIAALVLIANISFSEIISKSSFHYCYLRILNNALLLYYLLLFILYSFVCDF